MILIVLFLIVVFIAVLVAVVLATLGAVGIVLLVLLACFGAGLSAGPRDKLAAWFRRQTTVDPNDPKGRSPLQRDVDNFMIGFSGK